MSDKFSFRGGDPEGVPDGDYVLSVAGGHVTGLVPAAANAQGVREALTASTDDQVITLGGSVAGSPYVWINGALLWPGVDYSITENVIELGAPLAAGDAVWLSWETPDETPAASTLATLNAPTYLEEVLADSPLAFYLLNEASGSTATDSSGNLRHGSYNGTIAYGLAGPSMALPSAVETSGSASWVGIPSLSGLGAAQPQTWEIWFYAPTQVDASSAAMYLLGTVAGGNIYPMLLGASTGNLVNEVVNIGSTDSGGTFSARTGWTSPLTIAVGWHHMVVTYNGARNGWRLFIDATEVTGGKVSYASGATGVTATVAVAIGRYASGYSSVRTAGAAAYGSELTPERVAAHYAARDVV